MNDSSCNPDHSNVCNEIPALELSRLTRRFGNATAVDNLTLAVPRGTVLGLLGPNGAGKSTTLRMLMGLLRPSGGSIRVLGLDPIRSSAQMKQRVGYVPECSHIHRWMTVAEVISFAKALYARWSDDQCARLLDMFQLSKSKRVRQLSRGMLAKLSLLIALAHEPEILLLDEPLSGLDPIARDEFLDGVLDGLCQNSQRTILFSSHQLEEVNRLADSVAVLNRGRLLLHTTLDQLRSARRVRAVLEDGRLPLALPEETIWQSVNRREWQLTLYPFSQEAIERLRHTNPIKGLEVFDLSLDEIFKDLIRGQVTSC